MIHLERLALADELLQILDTGDGELGLVRPACACEVGRNERREAS